MMFENINETKLEESAEEISKSLINNLEKLSLSFQQTLSNTKRGYFYEMTKKGINNSYQDFSEGVQDKLSFLSGFISEGKRDKYITLAEGIISKHQEKIDQIKSYEKISA